MTYTYEFKTFPIDERGAAEFLGIDYDDVLRAREEEARLAESDPEVHSALIAHRKAIQRALVGL
jgi:hypothetical protein